MQAPTPDYGAVVANIQLTEFSYEPDYDFQHLNAVDLNVAVLTRAPPAKDQFDLLVNIAYLDQKTGIPVLKAACLTSYALHGLPRETNPQTGESTLQIPNALLHLMRIEAVAHARALVAGQAAATPFGRTYVATPLPPSAAEVAGDELVKTVRRN